MKSTPCTPHVVYQYSDPRDGRIISIGLTKDLQKRVKQHAKNAERPLYPLIQELAAEGLDPLVIVLETIETEEEGRIAEKSWIQRNKPLLNAVHNQEAINEREAARQTAEMIERLMKDYQWT